MQADLPREILRAAKIVHQMAQAHAAHKGAIGLDLSDDKGGKEMIDAPMLKQVRDPHISMHTFTLLTRPRRKRRFIWHGLQAFQYQRCLKYSEYGYGLAVLRIRADAPYACEY
jgi:hypothetical protein